jgi:hypothetical protein
LIVYVFKKGKTKNFGDRSSDILGTNFVTFLPKNLGKSPKSFITQIEKINPG